MPFESVLKELRSKADPRSVEGMARFGINPRKALGVPIPALRRLAKKTGRDHALALRLWATGIHEARILAAMVDDPAEVTESQMEGWVHDFDSWDVCDQVCGALFDRTRYAYPKAIQWCREEEEFVRRAGFVLMAELAVHDKGAPDSSFLRFFPEIERGAEDPRNFVKKAVNWALRQIGKRDERLNREAVGVARKIRGVDAASARWVGTDALRELEGAAVRARLRRSS